MFSFERRFSTSFKQIMLPSCTLKEVRGIPGLNIPRDAKKFLDDLPQKKLRSLWDNMSKLHRQNIRNKNIIIVYDNEKIDSNGYSMMDFPARKVPNSKLIFMS